MFRFLLSFSFAAIARPLVLQRELEESSDKVAGNRLARKRNDRSAVSFSKYPLQSIFIREHCSRQPRLYFSLHSRLLVTLSKLTNLEFLEFSSIESGFFYFLLSTIDANIDFKYNDASTLARRLYVDFFFFLESEFNSFVSRHFHSLWRGSIRFSRNRFETRARVYRHRRENTSGENCGSIRANRPPLDDRQKAYNVSSSSLTIFLLFAFAVTVDLSCVAQIPCKIPRPSVFCENSQSWNNL